jgi:putative hemolysin
MEYALLVLLLVVYALAAAAESSFIAANPFRLEIATPRRGAMGSVVRRLAGDPAEVLRTSILLRLVCLIGLATLFIAGALPLFQGYLTDLADISPVLAMSVAFVASVLALSIAVLAFGEVLPRSLALQYPERAARVLALPFRALQILAGPVTGLSRALASAVQRLGSIPRELVADMSAADMDRRIRASRSAATSSERDEGDLLFENVLTMAGVRVKDSMVPRTDIEGVEEDVSISTALGHFVESGYSKLPVYRDNLDNVVGVILAHDLFASPASLQEILRPARFVPESKPSRDLLREFLSSNTSIAIVIDEYGGTAGLVTREDLLEELFGDIQDEFDSDDDILERNVDGSILASGRVDLTTLSERFNLALPDGDYESLGGFLLERIGAIPPTGFECTLDGIGFSVIRATPNRIDLVRISLPQRSMTRAS